MGIGLTQVKMVWWILVGFFVWLLATILFAPLKLSLSTTNNFYFVSYGGAIKASAKVLDDDIELRFHLFNYSKAVSLMRMAAGYERKKSIPEKVADQVVKTTKRRVPVNILVAFVKSFRVKRCDINVDLGSVYYNAWLFPLGQIFSTKNIALTTNFEGRTKLELEIINRPAHMLWAIAKTQLKSKKS